MGNFLYTGAKAGVNFNDNPRENFMVERGVRQECPSAPYIFLIVRKTLTHIIKKVVKEGRLK